jgi:sulfate permease, SulP family
MAVNSAKIKSTTPDNAVNQYLPFTRWLLHYRRENLSGDLIAGLIVAVMLVPQSMAYALLAGLPPQVGLYASIAPLMIYGLLGTSRALAVGPVAMVSLLVASGIGALNPADASEYMRYALVIAMQVALLQLVMGVLRAGFLVNFLSHPVLSGFTSAAALIIGLSQLKHVLGFSVPRGEFVETFHYTIAHITQTHPLTLGVGLAGIAVLLFFKYPLSVLLRRANIAERVAVPLTKLGPLVIVILGVLVVRAFGWGESVAIVGTVPGGLPPITLPPLDMGMWRAVFPTALTIALVGYMESMSVAKALASRERQKINPDQELIALGAANVGAAFTGGYAVTGGLSRTMVNYTAGAKTGLASIITALLVALTVLFLTPLFYSLPQAALGAIILVAVAGLFDFGGMRHAWRYSKSESAALFITFFAVLLIGIENGILVGAAASIGLYMFRTSRPHIAIIGRIDDTEHFRNVERHEVETLPNALFVRVDESLYFPNASYLEQHVLDAVVDTPEVDSVVLVCSAVNYIDLSALEVLETLRIELNEGGVQLYFAELKGPVMDRLQRDGFFESRVCTGKVFLSAQEAFEYLRPPQPDRAHT